jgi:gamma-glutamylaminecyclotransferase
MKKQKGKIRMNINNPQQMKTTTSPAKLVGGGTGFASKAPATYTGETLVIYNPDGLPIPPDVMLALRDSFWGGRVSYTLVDGEVWSSHIDDLTLEVLNTITSAGSPGVFKFHSTKVDKTKLDPASALNNRDLFYSHGDIGARPKDKTSAQFMSDTLAEIPRRYWRGIIEAVVDMKVVHVDTHRRRVKLVNIDLWWDHEGVFYSGAKHLPGGSVYDKMNKPPAKKTDTSTTKPNASTGSWVKHNGEWHVVGKDGELVKANFASGTTKEEEESVKGKVVQPLTYPKTVRSAALRKMGITLVDTEWAEFMELPDEEFLDLVMSAEDAQREADLEAANKFRETVAYTPHPSTRCCYNCKHWHVRKDYDRCQQSFALSSTAMNGAGCEFEKNEYLPISKPDDLDKKPPLKTETLSIDEWRQRRSVDNYDWEDNHCLAVYGTLRKGEHNHPLLGKDAKFLFKGTTVQCYPMVGHGIPFVYDEPGRGGNIVVEVYEIPNVASRNSVDRLEGHPGWYRRELIHVLSDDRCQSRRVWMYFMQGKCTHAKSGWITDFVDNKQGTRKWVQGLLGDGVGY